MDDFDYIIAGAGSAGCVLAHMLSRDPSRRVLLLEEGGSNRHPILRVPKSFALTMGDPRFSRQVETQSFGAEGVRQWWTRGRGLGGSSAINGLVWNRGFADDYDSLPGQGAGWNWSTFLRIFKAMEDHELGASETRGRGGPVSVQTPVSQDEVNRLISEAGAARGWTEVADTNASDEVRQGPASFNTRNSLRVSSARAFLDTAKDRPNLVVQTDTRVDRLILEGRRVSGVVVEAGGGYREIRARKEVIVSMGSIGSPMILERSGIGKGDVLKDAGVDLVVESPNVGENVLEHQCYRMQRALNRSKMGYNHQISSRARQMVAGAKFLVTRGGPMSIGGLDRVAYIKTDAEAARPDAQLFMSPISFGADYSIESQSGMYLGGCVLRPTSKGSTHITGADATSPMRIDPNYFSTEYDRKVGVGFFRALRDLCATEPLASVIDESKTDPMELSDDPERILEGLVSRGTIGFHAVGGCAFGDSDESVLDERLRVRGVDGLRVVDASAWPTMPSGNCNAPTMALAWRASELILEDR